MKAYEVNYEFNKNDVNIAQLKTYTDVIHQGVRGTDQVVYFGSSSFPNTTGTNVYGYEIAVNDKGFIVDINTNVLMPKNGFVISGHGISAASLKTFELGDIVVYNQKDKTVEIYRHDLFSPLASASFNQLQAIELFENAKNNLYDFEENETKAILDDISNKINEMAELNTGEKLKVTERIKLNNLKNDISKLKDEVHYRTLPFRKVESVALWHRPTVADLTLDGTIVFLDKIQEAGVNVLLVETLWNSYPVYESEIAETNSEMVITGENVFGAEYGNDYLLCLITEAHKRGIEVHAWSQTLRGGTSQTGAIEDVPKHLKPEWLIKNYQGSLIFDSGMMYLDPTNPEVVEHLKALYKEMVNKYDWDGIELDYIRYPYTTLINYVSGSSTDNIRDGGYSEFAMNDFLKLNSRSGEDLHELIKTDKDIRTLWSKYRSQKVSDLVIELATMIRGMNPNLDISMAVAANANEATDYYMQNWMQWVQKGWIDTFRPMAYLGSVDQIEKFAIDYVKNSNNLSQLEMGLGSAYENFPAIINQLQMEVTIKNLGIGSSIFASQQIYHKLHAPSAVQESHKAMKLHTNRYEKISPYEHFQVILHGALDYLVDKMDRLYIPAENFANVNTLKDQINQIKKLPINSPSDYEAIMIELLKLSDKNTLTLNEIIRSRIDDDLNYLIHLLDVRINRELINNGYWDGVGNRPSISDKEFREFEKIDYEPETQTPEKKGCFNFSSATNIIATLVGIFALFIFVLRRRRLN